MKKNISKIFCYATVCAALVVGCDASIADEAIRHMRRDGPQAIGLGQGLMLPRLFMFVIRAVH